MTANSFTVTRSYLLLIRSPATRPSAADDALCITDEDTIVTPSGLFLP